jgi:hypothetical protein
MSNEDCEDSDVSTDSSEVSSDEDLEGSPKESKYCNQQCTITQRPINNCQQCRKYLHGVCRGDRWEDDDGKSDFTCCQSCYRKQKGLLEVFSLLLESKFLRR